MSFSYLIRRLGQLLPTAFWVITLVFFLIHFVPGDPVDLMLGDEASEEQKVQLRERLGLDLPVVTQYKNYILNLASGDLGTDIFTQKKVVTVLLEKVPNTFLLAIFSLFLACLISFPLGILSALRRGQGWDVLAMFFSLLGMSMPNFWLGPLLIILFSVTLGLTPISGFESASSILLPGLTMGASLSAFLTRMVRTSTLDVLGKEYITVAHAKGLSKHVVIWKHALRNAMIPIVTILGTQFGALMAGAVITESIFDWPGLGLEFFRAFQQRNYPVIQGCVLFIALSTMAINFLIDLLYKVIDPRVELN